MIAHPCTWQDAHQVLRQCNLVFSCVDGYLVRDELERYLRRFHVPLIDIGMDVTRLTIEPYLVYDGNRLEIAPSPRLKYLPEACPHYPTSSHTGDVMFSMDELESSRRLVDQRG